MLCPQTSPNIPAQSPASVVHPPALTISSPDHVLLYNEIEEILEIELETDDNQVINMMQRQNHLHQPKDVKDIFV